MTENNEESTPVYDALVNGTPQEKKAFVERAAKAVWGFITAFILAAIVALIPPMIAGRFPAPEEWITALGLGLAGAFGVGSAVYHVSNK